MMKRNLLFVLLAFFAWSSLQAQATKDLLLADYETLSPSDYAPEGTKAIIDNPNPDATNSSAKVLQYNKPAGDYKLYGFNVSKVPAGKIKKFEFLIYGDVKAMFIQAKTSANVNVDITWNNNLNLTGWNKLSYSFDWSARTDSITNIAIFPNMDVVENPSPAGVFLLDDIKFIVLDEAGLIPVQSISIPDSLKLVVDQTFKIIPIFTPEDASNKALTWASLNTDIVSVDATGTVKALKIGTGKVMVNTLDGNKKDTCTIEVGEPPVFSFNEIIANWEDVIPSTAAESGKWQFFGMGSNLTNIADNPHKNTDNQSEKVIQLNRPAGTWQTFGFYFMDGIPVSSEITGLEFLLWGSKTVKIYAKVEGIVDGLPGKAIVESPWPWTAPVGANAWNKVYLPIDNLKYLNDTITHILIFPNPDTETTEDVILIDEVRFIITKKVSGVSLDLEEKTIDEGETFYLTPTISPADATNQEVTWTSTNADVASVNSFGKVTGVSEGTAKIIVSTVDGIFKDTCDVTVNKVIVALTSIEIPATLNLRLDEEYTFTPQFAPSNASDKTLNWESSDNTVVSVDAAGKLTLTGKGTANITVTSVAYPSVSDMCVVTVLPGLGVGHNNLSGFRIYPNPVSNGLLNLRLSGSANGEPVNIAIFDLTGRNLISIREYNNGEAISLALDLRSGVYLIRVKYLDKVEMERFSVK